MVSGNRQIRLPSLASVAGSHILSLDFEASNGGYSSMQYSLPSNRNHLRRRASNANLPSPFSNLGHFPTDQDYDGGFSRIHSDFPPALPSSGLLPGSHRRARKYSSSSSLRGAPIEDDSLQRLGSFQDHGDPFASSRNILPPLPDLSSMSGLPPLGSLPALPPLGSSSCLPPLSHSKLSSHLPTNFGRNSLARGHHHQKSFGSYNAPAASPTSTLSADHPELDGYDRLSNGMAVDRPDLSLCSPANLAGGRRLRRRGSSADLRWGHRSALQDSDTSSNASLSLYDFGSTGFGTHSSSSLGMLPLPPLPRTVSRSGTGHIVLTTDYRMIRISHNVLIWLGMSSTSKTSAGTSMAGLVGQPISDLVAASDQLLFNDYLAELHAERRKAEKLRLHALSGSGDVAAKGVCKHTLDMFRKPRLY